MFRKKVRDLFCHKCGTTIHEGSHFCSNCGAKVPGTKDSSAKIVWLLPTVTFFVAVVVIATVYFYQSTTNSDIEAAVMNGEAYALEGDLLRAKVIFEQVLQKRPNHVSAAFNIEVIERGQHYEKLLEEVASFARENQFDDGLKLLEELDRELNNEEGSFFNQYKERSVLMTASLTVTSFDKAMHNQRTAQDLAELLEKIAGFTSPAATEMAQLLKEEIVEVAINHGEKFLQKNQFTEAEVEVDLGLRYDPTNETLLAFKETVKNERIAFEQDEQKRLEKALALAAEEDLLNSKNAIKLVSIDFSHDEDNGEFYVSGQLQNVGTRPISEIEVHYVILDEEGNELAKSKTTTSTSVVMPNEVVFFDEFLLISEIVTDVEIVDFKWKVE
jgi:tetratricopeptide (TPR) repeat protein